MFQRKANEQNLGSSNNHEENKKNSFIERQKSQKNSLALRGFFAIRSGKALSLILALKISPLKETTKTKSFKTPKMAKVG